MRPVVTTISVVTVNLPLRRPIVSAVGHYDKWPFIVTEITLDSGVVGNSYICPTWLITRNRLNLLFENFWD